MTGQTSRAAPRQWLAGHLEQQIMSGALQGGAKLPSERQLAEEFGLSRSVVREALRALVERNLIEVVPGRGTYVRAVRTTDGADPLDRLLRRQQATPGELMEARKMLECEAAGLAALRAEAGDLEAMDWALGQFDRSSDLLEQTRYDLTFHMSVARAAHNPVIETMFGSIASLVVEVMLRSLGDPEVFRAGVPYHRVVHEAIRRGDAPAARRAMAEHLSQAERLYGEDFDRSLDTVARRELRRLLGPGTSLEELLEAARPVIGAIQDAEGA